MKNKLTAIIVLSIGVVFGLWWLTTLFVIEPPPAPFTIMPNVASTVPTSSAVKPVAPATNELLFIDKAKLFSFNHSVEFAVSERALASAQQWMQNTVFKGQLLAVMQIPRSFMEKTNFSEATLTIGASSDANALTHCLKEENGSKVAGIISINGESFTKFILRDAGAGNFYDTTSYRIVRNKQCFVVEYTIHTTNIDNYSPDQGISAFDRKKVEDVLEGVVRSFTFLSQ